VAQVSGIIAMNCHPGYPGQYRTLVSCEPMATVADVPVAEEFEDYLDNELDHVIFRVGKNRCPRTSNGRMPKGAPMRDQAKANEFTQDVIAQALLNLPSDCDYQFLAES